MSIPEWIKDTRSQGISTALIMALLLVLYITHNVHPSPPVTTDSTLLIPPTFLIKSGATTIVTESGTANLTQTHKNIPATAAKIPLDNPGAIAPAPVPNTSAQELTASGGKLLKSLVNIVCLSGDKSIPSISGSGVIIDSRGIILTAAHVAQLFLLQDYLGPSKVACIIRTGSPARRAYLAEPIYVSPTWIKSNPRTLTAVSPQGTGENDFAFLAITDTATSTPLPNSFPSTPLAQEDPIQNEPTSIGSYGAQYLTASEVNYELYPILVFGSIQNRYTFRNNTVDIISIIGSAASQEGSSGGGIANANGQLIGMITTSSIAGDLSTRSLNAITIGHIRRSYGADTGLDLDSVLQGNSLSSLVASFAAESKILGQQLISTN